jgi:hypothetical protein
MDDIGMTGDRVRARIVTVAERWAKAEKLD